MYQNKTFSCPKCPPIMCDPFDPYQYEGIMIGVCYCSSLFIVLKCFLTLRLIVDKIIEFTTTSAWELVIMVEFMGFLLNDSFVSQPHFGISVRMKLTPPKVGSWSPPRLLKIQSSSSRVKTPRIEVLFISMERSWSVDAQNGFTCAIWTFVAQVMGKRKAGSQTGNLIPDH